MVPLVLLFFSAFATVFCYTPVVFWHGFANAYTVQSIEEIKTNLKRLHPKMYVKLLRIGDGIVDDFVNSVMMHPDEQIKIACDTLRADPALQNGYIGIGFSQGGLLLRGLAQRCSYPRMTKMITMGSMHQGVYGLPHCNLQYVTCRLLRVIYNQLMYTNYFQRHWVPATYWHNPMNPEQYRAKNSYLTDINNEMHINETYIKNLNSLDKFVMVKYLNEFFVVPPESEWFGYFKDYQLVETEMLVDSQMFTKDRLGLRRMFFAGKIDFLTVPWDHVEFHWDWFEKNIVDRYLT